MTRRPLYRARLAISRSLFALALAPALGSCGEEAPEAAPAPTPEEALPPELPGPGSAGAVHDRFLVFFSVDADTAVVMPWFFRASELDEGVLREQALWLARAGGWESLSSDTLLTPQTRTPWRILPTRGLRLAVGENDAVEALRFGALEVRPGEFLAEWSGPRGSALRLHAGRSTMPPAELGGLVVDYVRSWEGEEARPGDWIFLYAGPTAQLFLEERVPLGDARDDAAFHGWTRVAFQEQPWPEAEVTWEEVRAFERARRDIPVAWRLATPGGEVEGEIRSVSSHLTAGEGAGPLLPVAAFFEVEGEVRILGEPFPVRGLVRHLQP